MTPKQRLHVASLALDQPRTGFYGFYSATENGGYDDWFIDIDTGEWVDEAFRISEELDRRFIARARKRRDNLTQVLRRFKAPISHRLA